MPDSIDDEDGHMNKDKKFLSFKKRYEEEKLEKTE